MVTTKLGWTKLTLLAAYCAIFFIVVIPLVAGMLTPNYNHMSQYISELGASGAPTEVFVRFVGFLPAGLALLVFAISAYFAAPRSFLARIGFLGVALYTVGYLVAVVYPCDLGCRPEEPSVSQILHNLAGLVSYLLLPWVFLALGIAARKWPQGHTLSLVLLVSSLVCLLGLLMLQPDSRFVGLTQRFIEVTVLFNIMLIARYLVRHNDSRAPVSNKPETP